MRNLCNISSYKQVSEKGIICEDKQVCIKLKIQKKKKKSSNRYVCVPYIGNKPLFQFI